jgi:hypothetical protein
MFLAALFLACAADAAFAEKTGSDTGLTDDGGWAEVAACDADAGSTALEGAAVLFARGVAASALGDEVRVIEDGDAWAAIREQVDWGAEAPADPDFDAVRVVVASTVVASTCSLGVVSVDTYAGVVDAGVAPHVVAVFEDRTGACDVTCDAVGAAVAVVAVPREAGAPTVCSAWLDTCEGM